MHEIAVARWRSSVTSLEDLLQDQQKGMDPEIISYNFLDCRPTRVQ